MTENELAAMVQRIEVTVTRLATVLEAHAAAIASFVTRSEHEALKTEVARVEKDAEKDIGDVDRRATAGIDRNDKRWAQLVGTVCLIVLAAVVGLVVGNQKGLGL